jgi:hypothetical protein
MFSKFFGSAVTSKMRRTSAKPVGIVEATSKYGSMGFVFPKEKSMKKISAEESAEEMTFDCSGRMPSLNGRPPRRATRPDLPRRCHDSARPRWSLRRRPWRVWTWKAGKRPATTLGSQSRATGLTQDGDRRQTQNRQRRWAAPVATPARAHVSPLRRERLQTRGFPSSGPRANAIDLVNASSRFERAFQDGA